MTHPAVRSRLPFVTDVLRTSYGRTNTHLCTPHHSNSLFNSGWNSVKIVMPFVIKKKYGLAEHAGTWTNTIANLLKLQSM